MSHLGDLVIHGQISTSGLGGGSTAGGGGIFSGRSISSEVIHHVSVKLLNSLGLSTARIATTTAGGALSTALGVLIVSVLGLVVLGLGGSGGLGASLLTMME